MQEYNLAINKYMGWDRYTNFSKHLLVGSLAVSAVLGMLAGTTYENEANTRTHINDITHSAGHSMSPQTLAELESYQASINDNNYIIVKELELSALALSVAGITIAVSESKRSISE